MMNPAHTISITPHPDGLGGLFLEESSTENRATYVLFIDCYVVRGLWGLFRHIVGYIYGSIQELSVI